MEIKLCQIINNRHTRLNTKINAHIKEERLEPGFKPTTF